jgi:very-short-patch-repair endonuclease
MEFAENGARAIAEAFSPSGRETESPFEDAVMRALEEKGWEVHPQVGVSFFRVDLGVVHPDFPGRYLAGVECDGATYHRSATARDRDRLRELVLTDLGWRIRRIWSTEWWMNAASATDKIHARLTADLGTDRASRVVAGRPMESAVTEPIAVAIEPAVTVDEVAEEPDTTASDHRMDLPQIIAEQSPVIPPEPANDREPVEEGKVYARGPEPIEAGVAVTAVTYAKADPASVATPDRERFYDVGYRIDLRKMIDHVIDIEGPIYFDVLIDRIARAHGFQRSGETVQKIIRAALGRSRLPITKDGDREIVWPQNVVTDDKIPYRGAGGREHGDVPLPELAGLADQLRTQGLEDDEDLIRGMQEHFSLGRLAISTRQRFEAAVKAE